MTTVHTTRSGMVSSISYDEQERKLTLGFNSGGAYEYEDVPKNVFDELLSAESAGKYFHLHIRNKYKSEKI